MGCVKRGSCIAFSDGGYGTVVPDDGGDSTRGPQERPRSLARSLGLFVGHIIRGVKTDTSERDRRTSDRRTDTREERALGPDGERVTLRRTVIEEIEVEPADGRSEGEGR